MSRLGPTPPTEHKRSIVYVLHANEEEIPLAGTFAEQDVQTTGWRNGRTVR